jgi:hypothetical protein
LDVSGKSVFDGNLLVVFDSFSSAEQGFSGKPAGLSADCPGWLLIMQVFTCIM